MNSIGGNQGVGGPIPRNAIGGENFIRHIGNDKLIYDFKSGNGTTVKDRSREGNDGTFGAGDAAPTWKRNGLYFDGGDDVIFPGIHTTGIDFTFIIVATPDTVSVNNRGWLGAGSWGAGFFMSGNIPNEDRVVLTSTAVKTINSGLHINLAENFIAVSMNTPSLQTFFVNGIVKQRTETPNFNNKKTTRLGSGRIGELYWVGTIRKAKIIHKALSQIEIQQHYLANKFAGNN